MCSFVLMFACQLLLSCGGNNESANVLGDMLVFAGVYCMYLSDSDITL